MDSKDLEKYLEKASELLELESQILNKGTEADIDVFTDLFSQFYSGVLEIRDAFLEHPAVSLTGLNADQDVLTFLQSILNNDEFKDVEKEKFNVWFIYFIQSINEYKPHLSGNDIVEILRGESSEQINLPKKVEDKLGALMGTSNTNWLEDLNLFEELTYSWLDPGTYIQDLRRAGSIILKSGKLPENFRMTISTIKKCFAFQQHLAVIVLCRTLLEIALNDLYVKLEFTKKHSPTSAIADKYFFDKRENKNRKYINEYLPSPHDIRTLICKLPEFENFEDSLRIIYGDLSNIVHGRGNTKELKKKAEKYMNEVVWLIHEMYLELESDD